MILHIHLFLYKQLVYKQLALDGKLFSNFQGTTLFHQATIKTTDERKFSLSFCNKRKIAVKSTIQQSSAVAKALFIIFENHWS